MNNPKTTILGYVVLAGCILVLAQKFWHGEPVGYTDIQAALAFLTGLGLVSASDGGH